MDGVLCDSELPSRHAAVALFDQFYNVSVSADDFSPFTGTGEANFLAGVAALYRVPAFDPDEAKARFFDIYTSREYIADLAPFPGVVSLVQRVKALGLKVAVASAADRVKVDANLNAIGLPPETFNFITSSDFIPNKKPAPDVFLAAANGLNVRPDRCVVIEDAIAGVQAAKAAGMRCIAVSTSLPSDLLEKEAPDVIRGEPALIEIRDIFGEDIFENLDLDRLAGKAPTSAQEQA
ncbi:HAD-superfamily hydrolase [Chondrus crispus]|uniref:HAD-superfamily hydrolase n=1 Tax=Chondrus crispus TaxID=2769 RepID=R7QLK1_CHOCR|nr:HAD-superfamily hydrolase [Chondrus crispus]CDF39377.1 HAD-superfamily hydrolase [Chondrus crispus]|eukprot:XP_005719288.1 HAD-superfamily hydrolase [Chondrus crispus]